MAPKLVKNDKSDPFADFDLVSAPTAAPRSGPKLTPEQQRRQTFLSALEIQRNLWRDPSFTIKRRFRDEGDENNGRLTVLKSITPRAWWTTIGDLYEVAPRYGNRPLEITPGKFAARMKSDQVPAFFDKLQQLVDAGHYDEQFAKLSHRRKSE